MPGGRAFAALLLWSMAAPACLAQLPANEGGKVRTVPVPPIRTGQELDRFRESLRAACGDGLVVRGAPSPSDRVVQDPPPGAPMACARQVLTFQPPPEEEPPPALIVPTFTSRAHFGKFNLQAMQQCGPTVSARIQRAQSDEPSDTPVGQEPKPGTSYQCGEQLVLILSSGPPPLLVPTLESKADLADFASLATSRCGAPVPSAVEQRDSTKPPGTRLDQLPAPRTRYKCGDRLTLFVSAGPPPLTVPFFASPSDLQAFAKQAAAFCGQPLGSAERTSPSETIPKGARLEQTPLQGSTYRCGEEISLTLSDGPVKQSSEETATSSSRDQADTAVTDQTKLPPVDPVIPVPPPPVPPIPVPPIPVLLVPAFTSPEDMARFAAEAAEFCGTDPSQIATTIVTEPAGEWPAGAVLEQSPQRGTTFLCGTTALSLTLAEPPEPTPPLWKTLLPVALAALGIAALLALAVSRLVRVVPGAGHIQATPVGAPASPQPLLAVSLSARTVRASLLGADPAILEGP